MKSARTAVKLLTRMALDVVTFPLEILSAQSSLWLCKRPRQEHVFIFFGLLDFVSGSFQEVVAKASQPELRTLTLSEAPLHETFDAAAPL